MSKSMIQRPSIHLWQERKNPPMAGEEESVMRPLGPPQAGKGKEQVSGTAALKRNRTASTADESHLSPVAKKKKATTTVDPNMSYVVDNVQSHRRHGNKILYRVRWEPPFESSEHDSELHKSKFDRPSARELPPALIEYWKEKPTDQRPAGYRKLAGYLATDSASPSAPTPLTETPG